MGTPTQPNFNIDRAVRAALTDTPTKSKHAVTSPAILGPLNVGRQAVMKDLGEAIPQVSIQWFMDNILPPLRPGLNIATLVETLKNTRAIVNGYWAKFKKAPSKMKPVEELVFQPFADIARDVGEAAAGVLPNVSQTVVFKCNPDSVPHSKNRTNTSRPDGYGLYTRHYAYQERTTYWEFIVAPGEKKKSSNVEAINDNNQKITWSLNHIMREDACRRFVVGYTIEDSNMRLWFCSRSDILVTAPFNFRRKHNILVHFFVSLMYATPEQLGFDPTIKPAADPKARAKNQYDISICDANGGSRSFRTTRVISNIGAESIRGRGTRVWEAQELVNEQLQGDTVALKDCWIDDDRDREAVILQNILEAASKLAEATKDETVLNTLKKHLLTVVCYSDVYIDKAKDQTHTLLRRGAAIPIDLPPFVLEQSPPPKANAEESQDKTPVGPDVDPLAKKRVPEVIEYGIKSHHRIAFKQVGTTVDTLTFVSDICEILLQTLQALKALHALGWIHRDISSGNILVVDGVAKLTDFEYAKRMDDHSHHTLRTGTAYYMAIEVDDQAYHFLSRKTFHIQLDESKLNSLLDARDLSPTPVGTGSDPEVNPSKDDATPTPGLPPFRHNPLHDSEGIWWLLLRLTLDRDLADGNIMTEDRPRSLNRRAFYHRLFECAITRSKALLVEGKFARGQSLVHPTMLPVARALEQLRTALVSAYTDAEKDVTTINHTVAKDFCLTFLYALYQLRQSYRAQDVVLQPFRIAPAEKDTPEAPGATAPGPSLDSRIQAPQKRRRDDEYLYVGVDSVLAEAQAGDAGPSDGFRHAKRRRDAKDDEESSGSSADEADEAEVEELLGLAAAANKGKAKETSAGVIRVGRPKGKAKVTRNGSRSPAGAGTSTETATEIRRSLRLSKKTA